MPRDSDAPGRPIEFGGLKEAYLDIADARESCALGSVKGNVGHMDCAAGVSGLIKTALMLHRGKIPPMPNYSRPNPRLNIEESPFYIPTEMTDWPAQGHPRRQASAPSASAARMSTSFSKKRLAKTARHAQTSPSRTSCRCRHAIRQPCRLCAPISALT
ncbi:hypothetical protein AJ87_21735 [Rhizobium yanglingense]|nr:hypothetical protein AJ87_21735 [Rhizobium yanglingense]